MAFIDCVSDDKLRIIISGCNTYTDVLNHFGMTRSRGNYDTIRRKMDQLGMDYTRFKENAKKILKNNSFGIKYSLNDILIKNSTYGSRGYLKKRLIRAGLLKDKCAVCEMEPVWQGKNLMLILDHINGVGNDNRIGNLRLVCPNCNSQLETFCGANVKKIHRCNDCGCKTFGSKSRCGTCDAKHRVIMSIKNGRPSYNVLKNDVSENGYRATGLKYGVSDNAIRKWILYYEKYNLTQAFEALN